MFGVAFIQSNIGCVPPFSVKRKTSILSVDKYENQTLLALLMQTNNRLVLLCPFQQNEAMVFLSNWKKEYKLKNSRSRKQKDKLSECSVLSTTSVIGERNGRAGRLNTAEAAAADSTRGPSGRPVRMAFLLDYHP